MNEITRYNLFLSYLQHGLAIIPIIPGTKKPAVAWKMYQERLPTKEELRIWFNTKKFFDIAVVAGKVSGNLEIIDIDNHLGDADNIFWEWKEILINTRQDIWDKLLIQKTQSGGYHIIYRADDKIPHNTKIASRTVNNQTDTFIETRGEGGYALIYPSQNYSILQGSFQKIPYLTQEERKLIISICKSFNQQTKEFVYSNKQTTETSKNERPGDVFNQKGDIRPYLEKHGWQLVYSSGQKEFWKRPGKKGNDWSATFNFIPNKFYVFSTNAPPFEPEKAYDKFSVYTLLEHNGDFAIASRKLAELGFTANGQSHRLTSGTPTNEHKPPPLTQVGNAERFLNAYRGKLKYNHTNKEWLVWDGTRWLSDSNDYVRLLGKTISEQILKDEPLYVANGYDPKTVR
ncbi:MAG: bifunctional DNA primase/polymerase, partial [Fervidobacterium pennivorans]